ncbi:MAG: aryl-sulfate sulfotransferase [Pseudomonadota bacterium]
MALAIAAVLATTAAMAGSSVFPTGVTRYDPAKAYNSYVVFSGQDKKTHLIDMNGNEVHQWANEGFPPVLLDPALTGGKRGNILLQLGNQPGVSSGNGLGNKSIGELDWQGNVVWQWGATAQQDAYAAPQLQTAAVPGGAAKQHHDWRRLPNGNTLVLANLVHSVSGFKAAQVLDDVIYEVTPSGSIAWKWVASEHLEEFGFSADALKLVRGAEPRGGSAAVDYLHVNNMSVLGPNKWYEQGDKRFHPDNILIDSREANFIVIIDKQTGKVVWNLGPDYPAIQSSKLPRPVDQIIGLHDAHLIAKGLPGAGNLLVFDNQGEAGYPRISPGMFPHSRVLEIDPVSKQVVWEYTAVDSSQTQWSFYSAFISSARRLPNGNTLIDEGMHGRFFQVTPQGGIVWEYVSPYYGSSAVGGAGKQVNTNWVYRAQPVPYDWVPAGTARSERAVSVNKQTGTITVAEK